MVLVAGLDRLEGTKVGPWLTDAEWQDHTREVRERFEARSDTSVAFQDFCRKYAEGRSTTAAMRRARAPNSRARAPKGRDTAPLFTETIRVSGGTIYVDLKEERGSKFVKIKERTKGAPRYIIVPVDAIDTLRRALDGALATIRDGEYEEEDADVLSDVDTQTKSPEARPDRQVTGGGGNPCTCYVGGLNWETKEETLRELFDVYGSVQSVDIQEHAHTKRPKGWALVEFATAAEATSAAESCDGIELDGRELRVRVDKGQKSARPREARAARGPPAGKTVDPTKVFVTNLGHDESDYSLRGHCSSVGEVASVELLTRGFNGTQPTGSAVVQFYSAAAATAAIQDLNGTELNGRRLYVRAYFT